MKRLQLFLGVLFVTLGLHATASANNIKITFTVLMQESSEAVPPSATLFTTKTVRMTTKDFLTLLGNIYALPSDGGNLFYDGNGGIWQIRNANENVVHTISPDDLHYTSSGLVTKKGTSTALLIKGTKLATFAEYNFALEIDAGNYLSLNGILGFDTTQLSEAAQKGLISMTLLGDGKLDGKNCIFSGKIKINAIIPTF